MQEKFILIIKIILANTNNQYLVIKLSTISKSIRDIIYQNYQFTKSIEHAYQNNLYFDIIKFNQPTYILRNYSQNYKFIDVKFLVKFCSDKTILGYIWLFYDAKLYDKILCLLLMRKIIIIDDLPKKLANMLGVKKKKHTDPIKWFLLLNQK